MFHLQIKPISRSNGRTATAAAAYRSATLITDERTGEVHDYDRKGGVEHREIVLPAGAPAWSEDRAALWNAAEAAEKRKDARVAREYEVAIPKELTKEQGIALMRDFAGELVERYGVAVDFNVHEDDHRRWDGSIKGWRSYHAHVMASTRKLGSDGFGAKADIELGDKDRKARGLSSGAAEIALIRERWEVFANRHLERAGQDARIDRRSLKDQGIDREPTVHLGPNVTALERRGVTSVLGDINRRVMAEGQERASASAEIEVLEAEVAKVMALGKPQPISKKVPPSRAQKLRPLDLSGLDRDAQAQEAWEKKRTDERMAEEDKEWAWAWALEEVERQDRERQQRERVELQERQAAIAWAREEIARQEAERDLRVKEAVVEVEKRFIRRVEVKEQLLKNPPAAPVGLMAAFKKKAHQEAVEVWERACAVAARLSRKAYQMLERLSVLGDSEQVKQWAHGAVRQERPQAVAWYEQEEAQKQALRDRERDQEKRAEKLAIEQRAKAQALQDPAKAKVAVAQKEARRPVPSVQQKSLRQVELERDSTRAAVLLEKAKSEPLTLADKHQLVASWTAMGHLHDEGLHLPFTPDERRGIEALRQQAHRQVKADVFLNLEQKEALKRYPELIRCYAMLVNLDEAGQRRGLTPRERARQLDLAHRRLAVAIEEGQDMQLNPVTGELESVPGRLAPRHVVPRQGGLEADVQPDRKPPERG